MDERHAASNAIRKMPNAICLNRSESGLTLYNTFDITIGTAIIAATDRLLTIPNPCVICPRYITISKLLTDVIDFVSA